MLVLEGVGLLKMNENMEYGEQRTPWLLSHGHLSSSNCIPYLTGVSTKTRGCLIPIPHMVLLREIYLQAQPRPLHKWNASNLFFVSELQTLSEIPLRTAFWIMLYVLFASNYSEFLLYQSFLEMNTEYLRTEGKEFLASYNFLNVVLYEYIYQTQKSSKHYGKKYCCF